LGVDLREQFLALEGEGVGNGEPAFDFGQGPFGGFGEREGFRLLGKDLEDAVERESGTGEIGHPTGEEGEVRSVGPVFFLFAFVGSLRFGGSRLFFDVEEEFAFSGKDGDGRGLIVGFEDA
jgi:hypothetical protein